MEKDFTFKMLMSRIFWDWGYLPFLDVKIVRSDVALDRLDKQELTDVDVLGVKFLPEYRILKTAADCTTRKRGAMSRALFLRGTLDYIGADEGFVVVDPEKPLSFDHRVSARAIKVSLIDLLDAQNLLSRLELGQSELDSAYIFRKSAHKYLENINNLKGFNEALRYKKYRYWQDPVNEQLLNSIYVTKDFSKKIDLRQKFQFVLAYSYLLMFAIAALDITWRMASTTLTTKPDNLDLQLKYFLYGGEKNYKQRMRVVEFFSEKVGAPKETLLETGELNVAPPEWKSFLELYMRLLSNPTTASDIPRILGLALFEKILYQNDKVYAHEIGNKISDLSLKLATDMTEYFALATKLPSEFAKRVSESIDTSVRNVKSPKPELPLFEQMNAETSTSVKAEHQDDEEGEA